MRTTLALLLGLALLGCEPEDQAGADTTRDDEMGAETDMGAEVQTAFSDWDADSDGMLTEEEFRSWWADANPFERWDVDADANLSEEEWSATFDADMGEVDLDGDGNVTRQEVEDALFGIWDDDGDGRLGEDEWHGIE